MRQKKNIAPRVHLVIDRLPVTGEHYVKIQEKLGLDLASFLYLLGANMKDHFVIQNDLAAPITHIGLALNLQLLDRYPELVPPELTADDLVLRIKKIANAHPDLELPMRVTPSLVGLIVGRHVRTTSQWNTKKTGPSNKVVALMRTLAILLEDHPEPAHFLEEYLGIVAREAAARGERDLFTAKKWPPARPKNPRRPKPARTPPPED